MLTHVRYAACATFFLLAGACGNNNIGNDPCTGPDPEPSCGATCGPENPCPTGFYCGPGDQCTADCTPAGGECGSGYICNQDGQCIPDGTGGPDAAPADAMDCPSVQVAVEPLIPTVQLLIDQSGSMTADFGGVSRWNAVNTALVDPQNGAVTLLQDRVRFGASFYSSLGGNAGGTCAEQIIRRTVIRLAKGCVATEGNSIFASYGY